MQAVILAGGYGSRLAEETHRIPKPMVEIGGKPILWHILKIYSSHGINDFIICLGYKGYIIKEYFKNYLLHNNDLIVDLRSNRVDVCTELAEKWKITLVDTGNNVMTGGRLKRVSKFIESNNFCFTYGDGVGDVDVTSLIKFHQNNDKLATMTVAQPPGRFGVVQIAENKVTSFSEKPYDNNAWVNAGFFVLNKDVLELIPGDDTSWEGEPLQVLSEGQNLLAFKHRGFWQPMDTLRDQKYLNELWDAKMAKWKVWT